MHQQHHQQVYSRVRALEQQVRAQTILQYNTYICVARLRNTPRYARRRHARSRALIPQRARVAHKHIYVFVSYAVALPCPSSRPVAPTLLVYCC